MHRRLPNQPRASTGGLVRLHSSLGDFRSSFTGALCFNSWGLLAATAGGWFQSAFHGVVFPIDDSVPLDDSDFLPIVMNNGFVLLTLVAGVLTLGVYTFMVVIWNGYFLGVGLASLSRTTLGKLPLVAPHVSLELAALLLTASAAHVLMADVARCLTTGQPVRVGPISAFLAVAMLLVLVAASFEVGLLW